MLGIGLRCGRSVLVTDAGSVGEVQALAYVFVGVFVKGFVWVCCELGVGVLGCGCGVGVKGFVGVRIGI